jgi:hypothetical protein
MTTQPMKTEFTQSLKKLRKEIADYAKAVRCESRKRPKYLAKDSDKAIDAMRNAFENFISIRIK